MDKWSHKQFLIIINGVLIESVDLFILIQNVIVFINFQSVKIEKRSISFVNFNITQLLITFIGIVFLEKHKLLHWGYLLIWINAHLIHSKFKFHWNFVWSIFICAVHIHDTII